MIAYVAFATKLSCAGFDRLILRDHNVPSACFFSSPWIYMASHADAKGHLTLIDYCCQSAADVAGDGKSGNI